MSPMPKLFKRPRSNSEKALNRSTASRLSDIPASPPMSLTETLSMIHRSQSGTPVVDPGLPAVWGPLYPAGEGNPHSPLRNSSAIFNSSNIPPGPPPIDEAEIGGKFPSLSNGPGIERRVFIDPSYKRPQYLGPPAGRPIHRRSVSFDWYERSVLEPGLRAEAPAFLDAGLYNGEGFRQQEIASEQSNPKVIPHFLQEEQEESRLDQSTARGVLEGYSATESKAAEGGEDALQDSSVDIDPRLSQWAWSPAASICLPSSSTNREVVDPGPGTSQTSSSAARPGGSGIVRRGTPPLLFGSRAMIREDTSVGQAPGVGEEEWETVIDSRGLHGIEAGTGAGSSLADVSDSAHENMPEQRVVVHPAHPRYHHSWTMLEDAQSGDLVFTPEYPSSTNFPDQNGRYQHPAPLPSGHHHPFGGPTPVIGTSEPNVNESWSPPPVPMRSPARKLASPNLKANMSGRTFTQSDNEEWQTVDGGNNEVGSSLADRSSPLDAHIQHRNTVGSSLDPVRGSARGNFQELISQHSDLSPQTRQHRQHLIHNSVLPRLPTPPSTEPKHFTVPSHLLQSSSSGNVAMATRSPRGRTQPHPETRNANTMPGTRQTQWTGPYGAFIRDNRVPVEHSRRPIPAWRTDARAESSHFHRRPQPIAPNMSRREKEISRVFFALCCLIFPTLIIYGHGYLDGVMRQVSRGDFQGFRAQEKRIAIFLGYGLLFPLAIGLSHVFWT